MSIAATVNRTIDRMPPGRIFSYADLPAYRDAPDAVVRTVSRLAKAKRIKRLEKGRYYVPKQGVLGEMKLTDTELLRDVLFRNGVRRGYITGAALYNRLGLSTQIPKTVTVAIEGSRQLKDYGTLRIKSVPSRAPIKQPDVPLLELLDVLQDAKHIPDANPDDVLNVIAQRVTDLTATELGRLQRLAVDYYGAATRALLGLILTRNNQPPDRRLRSALNPLTRFQFDLDPQRWPGQKEWYIQ